MPYATNPVDGVRTWFEDDGGAGPVILFYAGLADPLQYSRTCPITDALRSGHRLVFADHRGHGRSDKPHDVACYDLRRRVGDFVAVLDTLGIDRAHFYGFSWGARLGFAVGEHAPDRVHSLILCGNQPYEWDRAWPFVPMLSTVFEDVSEHGMQVFLDVLEETFGDQMSEQVRAWTLANDPHAIAAAWRSIDTEGAISADLTRWRLPCLIYAAETEDMRPNAERAAAEIPGARFVALPGHSHLSAGEESDFIAPYVLDFLAHA